MLVGVAVEVSLTQMLKLHLSFVKVSVVVGVDDQILLPCFECYKEALQPRFQMSKSFSLLIPPPLTPDSCRRLYMLSPVSS